MVVVQFHRVAYIGFTRGQLALDYRVSGFDKLEYKRVVNYRTIIAVCTGYIGESGEHVDCRQYGGISLQARYRLGELVKQGVVKASLDYVDMFLSTGYLLFVGFEFLGYISLGVH